MSEREIGVSVDVRKRDWGFCGCEKERLGFLLM